LFTCTASAQTVTNKPPPTGPLLRAQEGEWQASKLVGVNVYNDVNEKIGDVNVSSSAEG
jgi:hypothetical protein